MYGAHRTIVTSIHRRQHIKHFNTTNLAQQNTIRAHAQGVANQLAGFDFAMALGIRRAGFQAHHMRVVQLQFSDILNAHQPFMWGDQLAEDIEQSSLAGAGAAADQDVAAPRHRQVEKIEDVLVNGARGQQVSAFEHVLAKLTDRQARTIQCHRRDDGIDPAAIGHTRVDHRRGFVQTPAQGRKDALHHALDMMGVDKAQVSLLQHAAALHKHPVRTVDQNLGDTGITQQHFQRAEAGQLIDDFLSQALHLIARQGQVQARYVVTDLLHHKLRERRARPFKQVTPAVFNGVDDVTMQGPLESLRIVAQVMPLTTEQFIDAAHLCPHSRFSQLALAGLLLCVRRAKRSPKALRCWVRLSRGANSNRVKPWFLAFSRTSGL
ncbi:hypothetical protein D3C78_663660 [compost metagenome]